MEHWQHIIDRLGEPFEPERIHWRIGARTADKKRGMALCYLDARDVMDRLDEVVGNENWDTDMTMGDGGRMTCTLGIHGTDEQGDRHYISKVDSAGATDIEGDKGAASDALKRVAVQFGIGRSLYRTESPWVELTPDGKRIADHEFKRLELFLKQGYMPTDERRRGASPTQSGGEPAGAPPSQDNDEHISASEKKQLYAANFEALKNLGISKGAIDNLPSSEKFEPLNYAVEQLGKRRIEQVRVNEISKIKNLITQWTDMKVEHQNAGPDDVEPF